MDWGMKNRLSRLIQKDGKALFLPIDHGYFQGPTHGLEHPEETIKPIIQYADGLCVPVAYFATVLTLQSRSPSSCGFRVPYRWLAKT